MTNDQAPMTNEEDWSLGLGPPPPSFHPRRIIVRRFRSPLPLDVAADAGDLLLRRLVAGQDSIDGGPQIAAGDRNSVGRPAVVKLAAVDEPLLGVVQEEVR